MFLNCFRSKQNGSCLYSSASLALVGNNDLISILRILTCIELFRFSNYYYNHPLLKNIFDNKDANFQTYESIVKMGVSFKTIDSTKSGEELIKEDAIMNCSENEWCSFFQILALSTIIKRKINIFYPDHGSFKLKTVFNQQIYPRLTTFNSNYCVNILCCYEGLPSKGTIFNHNHYVPLAFKSKSNIKRSASVSKLKPVKQIKLEQNQTSNVQTKLSFWGPMKDKKLNERVLIPKKKVSAVSTEFTEKCRTNNDLAGQNSPKNLKTHTYSDPTVNTKSELNNNIASDIAHILSKDIFSLEQTTILSLMNGVFVPDGKYEFPQTCFGTAKKYRKFSLSWFKEFSWLRYSPSLDGAFCLSCVFFGKMFPKKNIRAVKTLY